MDYGNAGIGFASAIEPARCYTTGTTFAYCRGVCEVTLAIDRGLLEEKIGAAGTEEELRDLRVQYLGRKGEITEILRSVGSLPEEMRAEEGKKANELRQWAEALFEQAGKKVREISKRARLKVPIDVTAPGIAPELGHRHPVSIVLDELVDIFWQMGYQVAEGPELETEWYNFEALLVGKDHPARDMQDTFYLENGLIPRTHTSSVQIRHMEKNRERFPIRIVVPGKVYRNEDEDARHSWSFNQLEGLVVDEGVSLGDLKGTLESMVKGVLGDDTKLRLRPSYFPYTEPSVEMDATCVICGGTGLFDGRACHLCGGTGWLELGGAGMVHPAVLRNVGIDPQKYSGFAFGFGPERIATIKFGVDDVREFWRPNLKFLEQF
jgi:phenylalanyl-tRNA synthetase alpha chain